MNLVFRSLRNLCMKVYGLLLVFYLFNKYYDYYLRFRSIIYRIGFILIDKELYFCFRDFRF